MTPRQAFVKVLLSLFSIRHRINSAAPLPDLIRVAGLSDADLIDEMMKLTADIDKKLTPDSDDGIAS